MARILVKIDKKRSETAKKVFLNAIRGVSGLESGEENLCRIRGEGGDRGFAGKALGGVQYAPVCPGHAEKSIGDPGEKRIYEPIPPENIWHSSGSTADPAPAAGLMGEKLEA